MCPADKEVFSSFAHAQVSITNEIYQYLGEPEAFLFCPTGTHNLHQNPVCILNICFTKNYVFVCLFNLKFRVLWNTLLPKCLSVPLPSYSRRKATTKHWCAMDRSVESFFLQSFPLKYQDNPSSTGKNIPWFYTHYGSFGVGETQYSA